MICENCSAIRKANLKLDNFQQLAYLISDGQEIKIELTRIEFRILHCLAKNEGQVLPRATIKSAVWGDSIRITERTIDSHICRIKIKIKESKCTIQSKHTEGYYFSKCL